MCLKIWRFDTEIQYILAFIDLKLSLDEIGSEPLDSTSLIDPPKMQNGLGNSQFPFLSIYDLSEDG